MRLIGEVRACRMDALATCLEHSSHWMLRQPVDLQVGMETAQLVSNGGVTLGMTKTDRRGDVQCALAPPRRRSPSRSRLRRTRKVAEQQIHLDRLTSVW